MITTVVYEVVGISSLLQNNPASMARPSSGFGTKRVPSPEEEAAAKVCRNDDGQIYVPAISFRAALLGACTGKRIGKASASSRVSAGVFNAETQCPLYHPKTRKPIKDYRLHSVRCVVQKNGVTRTRPEIPEWACKVALEIDTDFVSPETVLELLSQAGRICGVGDWRPSKRGPHGRFVAKQV